MIFQLIRIIFSFIFLYFTHFLLPDDIRDSDSLSRKAYSQARLLDSCLNRPGRRCESDPGKGARSAA